MQNSLQVFCRLTIKIMQSVMMISVAALTSNQVCCNISAHCTEVHTDHLWLTVVATLVCLCNSACTSTLRNYGKLNRRFAMERRLAMIGTAKENPTESKLICWNHWEFWSSNLQWNGMNLQGPTIRILSRKEAAWNSSQYRVTSQTPIFSRHRNIEQACWLHGQYLVRFENARE